LGYSLLGISVFGVFVSSYLIYNSINSDNVDPVRIISLMLVILVALLVIFIFLGRSDLWGFLDFATGRKHKMPKLRKRIITAFSIGAAVPTIIVAIFSTYFFNFGIQAWFDEKISKVLDESITVGESYVAEHILQLKETSISVAEDLNEMYYDLIHNTELFNKVLNAQADMRSLDEAIVFEKSTGTILAQTALSFSLAFTTLQSHILEKADKGEVVYIDSDPTKIRILVKLGEYQDTYLLIGRLIDSKIINHINKSNGAAEEYLRAKNQIFGLQIKFAMVFCLLALILLIAAIIWGRSFASRIVSPIRELVIAAEKVKNGDLDVQVPENHLRKDELRVLSSAFNRMVKQIDRQKKELIIAQRALAWSDVARKVAHEIKNPLTPIQLSAELLKKKFEAQSHDPENFAKYIQNILSHSNDIKKIVAEFVEFARLPLPDFSSYEVVSMINDLLESRKLISPNINYQFNSSQKEYFLSCDIGQINQALVNLLKNSEESFDKSITQPRISVGFGVDQDLVIITVLDNGHGFSDLIMESAKEAYITTKSEGTGLGLSIVEKIVKDHFGSMELFNGKEGGAGVRLIFNARELNFKLK